MTVWSNSADEFENSLFDFVLVDAWTLVTWYRSSLLCQEDTSPSRYNEAFVQRPRILNMQ